MSAFVLMAVFTTSGTFMLLFIAALQNIGVELGEAGMMDGANGWQRFWHITLPQLRPTLFTVITLGLIGCWQVFDQIYTGTQGGPAKTTMTPAYLSYTSAFQNQDWGWERRSPSSSSSSSSPSPSCSAGCCATARSRSDASAPTSRGRRHPRPSPSKEGRRMTTTLGTVEVQSESAGATHRAAVGGSPFAASPGRCCCTRCWCMLALVYIYPFLVQVATSFKTEPDAAPIRSR
jgi:ABC-type Fe3+ transport system permease subunit